MTTPETPSAPALLWRESTLAEVLIYAANRPRATVEYAGPWPRHYKFGFCGILFEDGTALAVGSNHGYVFDADGETMGCHPEPPWFWIGEPAR